jgi:ankyrin repeat protein
MNVDKPTPLLDALRANDAAAVARVLAEHPELKTQIDAPLPAYAFGETPLIAAVQHRNREAIDVLLRAGANVNQKSHWWAGGFHAIDNADDDGALVAFLLERGAVPEIHHLVRLGRIDEVRAALKSHPALINARGGDGQLPLHFAKTVEMAGVLIEHGADIDAIDVDHESTAAQWMVRDRQPVARHLVDRGGRTDLLMASAFGDAALVTRLLDADPDAIRTTVSDRYFPMRNQRAGGTIYNWTLGASKSAHEIAREFGHEDVVRLLMDRTPDAMNLAVACELEDEALVRQIVAREPGMAATLPPEDRRKLADAARNEKTTTVRLMLDAGWPVDVRGQHNATALHWAGFHGNAGMARTLVERGAPLEVKDDDFDGTPLHWAIYGSQHGWRCKTGDYVGTVDVLLSAGAQAPPLESLKAGTPAVLDVLRRHASG